jgi:hypothetical protein
MIRRKGAGVLHALFTPHKVAIALALSGLLDWMEWAMHHPPDIWFVVVFHFVFALGIVSIVVFLWQRLAARCRPG